MSISAIVDDLARHASQAQFVYRFMLRQDGAEFAMDPDASEFLQAMLEGQRQLFRERWDED